MTATKENTKPTNYKITLLSGNTTAPQELIFSIVHQNERYQSDDLKELIQAIALYFGPEEKYDIVKIEKLLINVIELNNN